MDWLPRTIDALTNAMGESGIFGKIAFLMALGTLVIVYRHLGNMLDVLKYFVAGRKTADEAIIASLNSIAHSNAAMLTALATIPKEKLCGALGADEIREIVKQEIDRRRLDQPRNH